MEFGAPFFYEFNETWANRDGYRLSRTLNPDIPTEKLRKIWRSQNAHGIKDVLKRGFQGNAALMGGLSNEEMKGWVEVYHAYWNAAGEIAAARESNGADAKVSQVR